MTKLPQAAETLEFLHHQLAMNTREIAERYGATPSAVQKAFRRFGIENRDAKYGRRGLPSGGTLAVLYYQKGMTLAEIAAEYKVSRAAVRAALERNSIPRRRSGRPSKE